MRGQFVYIKLHNTLTIIRFEINQLVSSYRFYFYYEHIFARRNYIKALSRSRDSKTVYVLRNVRGQSMHYISLCRNGCHKIKVKRNSGVTFFFFLSRPYIITSDPDSNYSTVLRSRFPTFSMVIRVTINFHSKTTIRWLERVIAHVYILFACYHSAKHLHRPTQHILFCPYSAARAHFHINIYLFCLSLHCLPSTLFAFRLLRRFIIHT